MNMSTEFDTARSQHTSIRRGKGRSGGTPRRGRASPDVKKKQGTEMLRFDADRELTEDEVLQLEGEVLLSNCELSATWGGSVTGKDARIAFEQSCISGNVSEHDGGRLDFDRVHFHGSAPEGEALISLGASVGRFRRCVFEDIRGTALAADLLGCYPPFPNGEADDTSAPDERNFLGTLLRKGKVHASVHLAVESCEFRNCRATGELAAPIQLLTADLMHTAGLVLFRDCTFESCTGSVGLCYVQDVSASREPMPDRWPLRVAFVNCRFVNCHQHGSRPPNHFPSPRIVLQKCEFAGCRDADLFYENIDDLDLLMEAVLKEIGGGDR